MALSSRNPFRSNAATPNITGTSVMTSPQLNQTVTTSPPPTMPVPPAQATSPPPTFSDTVVPPAEPQPQVAENRLAVDDFEVRLPIEEPPPYSVRPSSTTGETTIAQGPRRPFQRAPSPPTHITPAQTGGSFLSTHGTLLGRRPGGLLQQLTNSLNSMVDSLNYDDINRRRSTGSPQRAPQNWSAYPGQQRTPPQAQYAPPPHPPPSHLGVAPPPRHPASPSRVLSPELPAAASSEFARDFYAAGAGDPQARVLPTRTYTPPPDPPPVPPPRPRVNSEHLPIPKSPRPLSTPAASSDFARDFYAVGVGEPDAPGSSSSYAPPPGPPPHHSQPAAGPSTRPIPNDGRPTTVPTVGHPLLKDGKILIYPKRHECDKCHNVGYKASDPSRPCKKCWPKYAKPFTGPIVYSFSNTNPESTFQRPLTSVPVPAPPPRPSPMFATPQQNARFAPGGYVPTQQGGFISPPTGVHPVGVGRPPPGAMVYQAGDPRLGGRLCWRCDGKGNVSFLFLERITCEVCGGIGRTFN
ncbi:hypothetical protein BDN70DRAFT_885820 [Pholiota conissans]|uniref:Uncharacterized protein n=1 Tax=Pholiota conissans TaxID=109636 RepID=A0A9P5YRN9_9AGAR|nr:hypothetical protein BDN70DRAFT_885820 [Pholiota conissans]